MSWSRKQWVINSSRLMTLAVDIDYIINNERHLHCFSQDNIYRLQRRYRFFIGYRKKCWKDWSLVVQSPNSKISEYCFVRWDGCVWRLPWPYTFRETLGAQLSLKWLFNWNLITERQELIKNDGYAILIVGLKVPLYSRGSNPDNQFQDLWFGSLIHVNWEIRPNSIEIRRETIHKSQICRGEEEVSNP